MADICYISFTSFKINFTLYPTKQSLTQCFLQWLPTPAPQHILKLQHIISTSVYTIYIWIYTTFINSFTPFNVPLHFSHDQIDFRVKSLGKISTFSIFVHFSCQILHLHSDFSQRNRIMSRTVGSIIKKKICIC